MVQQIQPVALLKNKNNDLKHICVLSVALGFEREFLSHRVDPNPLRVNISILKTLMKSQDPSVRKQNTV